MVERSTKLRLFYNLLFKALVILMAFLALCPLLLILFQVFARGLQFINWNLLTCLTRPVGVPESGIANALVGTLMLVSLAIAIAVPLGVGAGIYLSQCPSGRVAQLARLAVDILQGMPSVVIGLLAYTWLVRTVGRFSALSGAVALAVMMLPLIVRSSEEVLKLIPPELKEASLALGVPNYRTVLRVVVPCGLPGILSGVLLGVSRVSGETAPLLFTAFGNNFMSFNPLKPVHSLPLLIFVYALSPYEEWQNIAWGASVVLILLVLSTNIISRVIIKRWKIQF